MCYPWRMEILDYDQARKVYLADRIAQETVAIASGEQPMTLEQTADVAYLCLRSAVKQKAYQHFFGSALSQHADCDATEIETQIQQVEMLRRQRLSV